MLFALLACATPDAPTVTLDEELATAKLASGDPEVVGLLAFLNDASTTVDVLDHEVPLDARAARNLISRRDGPDGVFGTADDSLFESREEVDDVRYVGPSALAALAAHVEAQGWVPEGDDELGTWDGVTFTVDEAAATVELANTLDETTLDVDLALDRRAVNSILDARDISDVGELAGLYFVGQYALTTLLDAALDTMDVHVEEEDEPCAPTVVAGSNADASDLSTLLELTTTVDAPWSEVIALEASGCSSWDDDALDTLTGEVFGHTYVWSWSEIGSFTELDGWTEGGEGFTSHLELALVVIGEHLDDGDFDPADPAISELYEARQELVDALTETAAADPGRFLEQYVYVDMVECSQDSWTLLDTETGEVLVSHEFSHC